ncbi:MAG: hypothetical protein JSS02_15780 [Planctomycetes bacterium]|nr:hypothetical protein [Planctomycetota bacterium]
MTVLLIASSLLYLRISRSISAIREIERLGGLVQLQTRSPKWLDTYLGDEWIWAFRKPLRIELHGPKIDDATLQTVSDLNTVKSIVIYDTRITDAGLKSLAQMPNLETLLIQKSRITDAGLKHLTHLPALKDLWLIDTEVTDDGFAELQRAMPWLWPIDGEQYAPVGRDRTRPGLE